MNVLKNVEPLIEAIKIIEMYQNTQEYTATEREHILKLKDELLRIKNMLRYDYERHVQYIKNASADGTIIAARLLYYPFMKTEYKNEHMFEVGLTEHLRSEKITDFSITEHNEEGAKPNYT